MRSSRQRFARAERCMNDERSRARAWLAKAESDRLAARRLLEAGGPFDAVCFDAQQPLFIWPSPAEIASTHVGVLVARVSR